MDNWGWVTVKEAMRGLGGSFILWHLSDTTLRYGELSKLVPKATPKMLPQQLREIRAQGLVIYEAYSVVLPRVDYSLPERRKSLFPILEAMYDWGQTSCVRRGSPRTAP